jgi:hypothetical protein
MIGLFFCFLPIMAAITIGYLVFLRITYTFDAQAREVTRHVRWRFGAWQTVWPFDEVRFEIEQLGWLGQIQIGKDPAPSPIVKLRLVRTNTGQTNDRDRIAPLAKLKRLFWNDNVRKLDKELFCGPIGLSEANAIARRVEELMDSVDS